jgi:hypothetical protein
MDRLDLDRFVSKENIMRLKLLADSATSDAERKKLLELLSQESEKFKGLNKDTA